jgi:hypothetical protein
LLESEAFFDLSLDEGRYATIHRCTSYWIELLRTTAYHDTSGKKTAVRMMLKREYNGGNVKVSLTLHLEKHISDREWIDS